MSELRLMVGIPGSGKSTLAEYWLAMGEVDVIVSSDAIRGEVTGDPGDVSRDAEVWKIVYDRIVEGLHAGKKVVLDATSLTPKARRKAILVANSFGIEPQAHVLRVEYADASARNKARSRVVPQHVMERMYENYVEHCQPRKILYNEGFQVFEYWQEEGGDPFGDSHQEGA